MKANGPYQPRQVGSVASLLIELDERASTPLYEQIFDGVRARILAGELAPGARLPSSRQLASELGVARTTVLQAFEALAAEGYLVTRAAASTCVAPELPDAPAFPSRGRASAGVPARASAALAPPPRGAPRLSRAARRMRDLPGGAPHLGGPPRAFRPGAPALDLFPTALWARIVARHHARASTGLLHGGDPAGLPALRAAIAAHVSTSRGVRCEPAQVFVTAGTQAAFDEILRLVVDPGDPVWLEDPGYLGARRAVLGVGAELVPVPVDDAGLDVDAGIARAPDARAVVVAPSHQYPFGVTLGLARRIALLRWARRARAVIIEDDYDSEFRHRGRPLTALAGLDDAGCTVYVGTFSKTLFPGLRLGFFVAPPALVDVVAASRATAGPCAPALEQAALATFIADGHFARHLRRMRVVYRERSAALVDALTARCGGALEPRPSETGMQLWAALRHPGSSDRVVRDLAAQHGIELAALTDYFLGRPRSPGLVFGFGGVPPAAIRRATEQLARVLDRHAPSRR